MTEPPIDPFTVASSVRSLGDGSFVAELSSDWTVGTKPHGGYLLALLGRAAIELTDDAALDPLSVSAQFLRPPRVGPVLLRTETLKVGRTATVVRAVLEQSGRACVDATLTMGRLPEEEPAWVDLPEMPINPPAEAIHAGSSRVPAIFELAQVCDLRLDPASAGFLDGATSGPLRLRLWARPRSAQPDPLFTLVAGDLTMPVTFHLGRFGWSPTVQLTALVRARPANGWLRLAVDCRAVHGQWFDEDTLVIDSTGRLVCQARQLALSADG